MVRNTKAKIRRTNQKYGVDISDEVELPKLGEFKTREEYNQWKEEIKSFTNRNNAKYQFVKNEYGVVASKKKIRELESMTKEVQKNAEEFIDKYKDKPYHTQGKEQGTLGQHMLQMGRPNVAGVSVPKDFNFSEVRNKDRLEKIEQRLKTKVKAGSEYYDKRMEKMRENYIELLSQTFNSDADELIEQLKNMPVEDFYELYLTESEFDFNYIYTDEGSQKLITQLTGYVKQYSEGKMNPMFDFRP